MKSGKSTVKKRISEVPFPSARQAGWLSYGDKVVFILIENEEVKVRTGHICSSPGSHGAGMEVDNIDRTVVWSDQALNSMASSADDVHEKSFSVKDPCLLRRDEIHVLSDPSRAAEWFKCLSPGTVRKIMALLAQPDFGISAECKKENNVLQKSLRRMKANLEHWTKHGRPHPVHGSLKRARL